MEYVILIILIMTSIADWKYREIPDSCLIALIAILPFTYVKGNVQGAILALPFLIASGLPKGMGGGDWRLIAILGLCLGLFRMFWVTVIGCVVFIVIGYIVQAFRRSKKSLFPFAPALTMGYIILLVLEGM